MNEIIINENKTLKLQNVLSVKLDLSSEDAEPYGLAERLNRRIYCRL